MGGVISKVFKKQEFPNFEADIPPQPEEVARVISEFEEPFKTEIDDPPKGDPCGLYVKGIPLIWNEEKFKKLLDKNEIKFNKVVKNVNEESGSIYFDSVEERGKAYTKLSCFRVKNNILYVIPLRNDIKKLQSEISEIIPTQKKNKKGPKEILTPWCEIEYEEQIRQKLLKVQRVLDPVLPKAFQTPDILRSPKIENYQNIVELTIDKDDVRHICIGFRLGSPLSNVVTPIDDTIHLCESAYRIVPLITNIIKESQSPVFDRKLNEGIWKFIKIIENDEKEVILVIATFGPLMNKLTQFLIKNLTGHVTSLYHAEVKSAETLYGNSVLHHLFGPKTIKQQFNNVIFEIDPFFDFLPNFAAANVLLSQMNLFNDKSQIIDVGGCHPGVISVSMAKSVQEVIICGLNNFSETIQLNCLDNITFLKNDNFENIAQSLTDASEKMIFLHPTDTGVRRKLIQSIRSCTKLRNIMFISPNPDLILNVCQSFLLNTHMPESEPYQISNWAAVDLYPNTDKVMILLHLIR